MHKILYNTKTWIISKILQLACVMKTNSFHCKKSFIIMRIICNNDFIGNTRLPE